MSYFPPNSLCTQYVDAYKSYSLPLSALTHRLDVICLSTKVAHSVRYCIHYRGRGGGGGTSPTYI